MKLISVYIFMLFSPVRHNVVSNFSAICLYLNFESWRISNVTSFIFENATNQFFIFNDNLCSQGNKIESLHIQMFAQKFAKNNNCALKSEIIEYAYRRYREFCYLIV